MGEFPIWRVGGSVAPARIAEGRGKSAARCGAVSPFLLASDTRLEPTASARCGDFPLPRPSPIGPNKFDAPSEGRGGVIAPNRRPRAGCGPTSRPFRAPGTPCASPRRRREVGLGRTRAVYTHRVGRRARQMRRKKSPPRAHGQAPPYDLLTRAQGRARAHECATCPNGTDKTRLRRVWPIAPEQTHRFGRTNGTEKDSYMLQTTSAQPASTPAP